MTILQEAQKLITGARAKSYGNVREDYKRTVALFKIMTGVDLTPEQGVMFMRCMKMSKKAHMHIHDTCVDDVGYASLYCDMVEGKV